MTFAGQHGRVRGGPDRRAGRGPGRDPAPDTQQAEDTGRRDGQRSGRTSPCRSSGTALRLARLRPTAPAADVAVPQDVSTGSELASSSAPERGRVADRRTSRTHQSLESSRAERVEVADPQDVPNAAELESSACAADVADPQDVRPDGVRATTGAVEVAVLQDVRRSGACVLRRKRRRWPFRRTSRRDLVLRPTAYAAEVAVSQDVRRGRVLASSCARRLVPLRMTSPRSSAGGRGADGHRPDVRLRPQQACEEHTGPTVRQVCPQRLRLIHSRFRRAELSEVADRFLA